MEPEWMRVEHRCTLHSSSTHTRHWFSCEIPDEDENSGDDDWCHVADVFVTFEFGIINRIEIVMAHNVNELFDSAASTGHFQKVIIEELRKFFQDSFNSREVALSCLTFSPQPEFLYDKTLHEIFDRSILEVTPNETSKER